MFIAMLAVGPLAILPAPVWAAVPTTSDYTVTNGSVSLSGSTFTPSDRAVLVWNQGKFNIAQGETWSFNFPSGGAVLNKVGYTTTGGPAATKDNATINGTLFSNGTVFVLANGNIIVGPTATLQTSGGLVLSTLAVTDDFTFTSSFGSPTVNLTGASTGDIVMNTANVGGSLSLYAGRIVSGNLSGTSGTAGASTLSASATPGTAAVLTPGTAGAPTIDGGGAVTAIPVGTAGANYTTAPTVTLSAPPVGGTQATATATIDASGAITGFNIVNAGSGYAAAPTVTVSGVAGAITAIPVTAGGTNYTTAPSVTLSPPPAGGTQATATAVLTGGVVTGFTITNAGAGYTAAPTVTVSPSGAVTAIAPGTAGTGYVQAPAVTLSAPPAGGVQATATAVLNASGAITGFTITNAGQGYTSAPTATVAPVQAEGMAGGTISGNLIVKTVTPNAGINLASFGTAGLTVTGNLNVQTNNGAITQTNSVKVSGNETRLNSGANAAITLTNVGNDFNTVFANTTGTGDVSLTDMNVVVLGTSAVGRDLSVTSLGGSPAGGGAGNVSISSNGTLTIGGNANFTQTVTQNANVTIGDNSTVGGLINASLHGNTSFTFNGAGNIRIGNISSSGSANGNRSGVTVSTNGTITIDGAAGSRINLNGGNNGSGGGITLTAANIVQDGPLTTNRGGTVTMNATSGGITLNNNINVGATGNGSVSLRTAGGAIQQNGGVITTGNASQTPTFNATTSGSINLAGANNFDSGQVLQITAGTATINATGTTGSIAIGTSNVTGSLTVNGGGGAFNTSVVLGAGEGSSGQDITVGGALNVNVLGTGTITDADYGTIDLFGPLNLTTAGGAITLNAARANGGLSPRVRFGQVNVTAPGAAVTVAETTTLNLGGITAATLSAYSNESIINTGTITTTGSTLAEVGSTGTINLTGSSNSFTSLTLSGGTDVSAHSGAASLTVNVATPAPGNVTFTSNTGSNLLLGTINAGNLTVNSGGFIDVQGTVTAGNATLTAGSATLANTMSATTVSANIIQTGVTIAGAPPVAGGTVAGKLNVSGTATINSPALLHGANDFGSVVLGNISGAPVTIHDVNNLTVSGNATEAVTVVAGADSTFAPATIASQWALTLGNLNISGPNGSLTAAASSGGGGDSGPITQATGTSIHVDNALVLDTVNGNITLGNNGNSAGRVELRADGNANTSRVTYVEDGTIKLGNLTSRGGASLTSRFGSIIEDPTANNVVTSNGTLTLNAVAGSVTIGNTTHTAGGGTSTTGNITAVVINAPSGAASVTSNSNIALGNVNVNSLTVSATNNITQTQPVRVFGVANFTAGRNIVLTNNSNNFGPVMLATTGVSDPSTETIRGNISVTEAGTLNLRSVAMGTATAAGDATFTARSVNGDIVDTGLGGVKLGGRLAAAAPNSPLLGTGVVSLTATNGNIVIDDPTSDVLSTAGVVFSAKDVTLSVLGSPGSILRLGANSSASSATGNLIARSALGNIGNLGQFTVGGVATFETGNGNITINQPNVGFGQLRFTGNQVSIQEGGNMDILPGSSAFGNAQLVSGGSISIATGPGSVTFGSNVAMQAANNITLRQTQVVGNLTISHGGTADLSALSNSTDLNGRWVNTNDQGPGAGPQTNAALAPKP